MKGLQGKRWMITKNGEQVCPVCLKKPGENKPLLNCPERHKRRFMSVMRYQELYKSTHRQAVLARNRESTLKRRYGITENELHQMLELQHGECAICHRNISGVIDWSNQWKSYKRRACQVDHDHRTGSRRGLLCNECNNLLGRANDDIRVLQSAIEYLQKWQSIKFVKLEDFKE